MKTGLAILKETEAFVHIIEEKMEAKFDQRKHELATKEDIYRLKNIC